MVARYWFIHRRPQEEGWPSFDALKPIMKIVLTNRDHIRDTELFRERYGARLAAGEDELAQLAPLTIDEPVRHAIWLEAPCA